MLSCIPTSRQSPFSGSRMNDTGKSSLLIFNHQRSNRYFVLTASDLEGWYQNPESFHHEQDMIQWSEKLRPCAEALYMVLFENYSQVSSR